MHAGSFRVSVIHQTLTRATGYLTCVRGHSYAWTQTDSESAQLIFDSEISHNIFYCAPDAGGVRTLDLESDALPTEPPRHPLRIMSVIHDIHLSVGNFQTV